MLTLDTAVCRGKRVKGTVSSLVVRTIDCPNFSGARCIARPEGHGHTTWIAFQGSEFVAENFCVLEPILNLSSLLLILNLNVASIFQK